MDRLRAKGAKRDLLLESSMADILYPLLGAALISAMALYAAACARL